MDSSVDSIPVDEMTDEVVNQSRYGALPLSYGAAITSRAGGIRTHNLRLRKHVLQLGSRSRIVQRPNEVFAETRCLGHQVNSLDVVPAGSWALRDAGGSRTHLDRTCSRLACRLAPASQYQCPRQESNLVYDLRKVVCGPAHSEDMLSFSSPLRNRTPSCRSEVCRAVHHTRRPCCQRPDLESNQDQNLRRIPCAPLHHRDNRFPNKGRRLDSHQHEPVDKTGAFLSRATSA